LSKEETLEEFATAHKKTNPDATDEDIKTLFDAKQFALSYKKDNPKATDEDIKAAWGAKQTEGMNLTDKITKVMDDYGSMLIKQMEARLQTRIDEIVKATQDELVGAIRKGVGLDEDPIVHLSEVTSVVRKLLLEKDEGKITTDDGGEGPPGKPAEGEVRKFDLDGRFNELTKGRGVV